MTYELVDAGNANFPLGPSGMATGDIDGDGDVDVVATGQHGYAALTNDGDGGFALAFPGNSGTAMGSPSLVDVDGDRDLDMVGIVGGGGTSLPAVPFVQRNDGSGAFGDIEADPSAQPPGELDALVPADVDHDGDTDLLGAFVGGQQRRVGVFANDGTGAFADPVSYPLGFTSDTVSTTRWPTPAGSTSWCRATSTGTATPT